VLSRQQKRRRSELRQHFCGRITTSTGETMNINEMTPRERQIEKLKDYLLAVSIGLGLAWILVESLSK
jgi:hypothetical protein